MKKEKSKYTRKNVTKKEKGGNDKDATSTREQTTEATIMKDSKVRKTNSYQFY
jgi:hypothetical protein